MQNARANLNSGKWGITITKNVANTQKSVGLLPIGSTFLGNGNTFSGKQQHFSME
jgi:hypothetical protein